MTEEEAVKIFVSYSHKDDVWQEKISAELGLSGIDVWADRKISPGAQWLDEIERELAAADIIVLLISRDFLISDFVKKNELPKALRRLKDEGDGARVVPVLLRKTTWKPTFDLGDLNAIPRNEQWLTTWKDEDDAIESVAQDLGVVVDEVKAARAQRRRDEDQYVREVAEALADYEISPLEERTLEAVRARLGIPTERARELRQEEQRRVDAALEKVSEYETDIEIAIRAVGLPLDEFWRAELEKRKAKLGLRPDDVAGAEDRVMARLEAADAEDKRLAAQEQAAKDKAAQEQAAKDKAAQEQAAKDKAAQEQAAKDKAAQEQAAKDKAAQEQAAKDKAAAAKKNNLIRGLVVSTSSDEWIVALRMPSGEDATVRWARGWIKNPLKLWVNGARINSELVVEHDLLQTEFEIPDGNRSRAAMVFFEPDVDQPALTVSGQRFQTTELGATGEAADDETDGLIPGGGSAAAELRAARRDATHAMLPQRDSREL